MEWREGDPDETPVVIDEEFERYEREVVLPRLKALQADPTNVITLEELDAAMLEWDREDGLKDEEEQFKRSA